MNNFIEKLYSFIQELEERDFYKYLAIVIGIIILIVSILIFNYSRKIYQLKSQIRQINIARETQVRPLLEQAQAVAQEEARVRAMLAQNPDFNIGSYFETLKNQLNLGALMASRNISIADKGDYRETLLKAKFTGMSMRQLTELLQKIEQSDRIYTKDLQVTRSKKTPPSIDVNVTIGTLHPKESPTEY